MKIIKGDLIDLAMRGEFDVIIHGCNCMCTMGKGIAKQVKQSIPEAYLADCDTEKGSRSKLGRFSFAKVSRRIYSQPVKFTVVNAYTQFDYRGGTQNADYDAIRAAFKLIKQHFSGRRIGYPKIGAGEARGDWSVISKIIDDELEGENHTLVEWIKV